MQFGDELPSIGLCNDELHQLQYVASNLFQEKKFFILSNKDNDTLDSIQNEIKVPNNVYQNKEVEGSGPESISIETTKQPYGSHPDGDYQTESIQNEIDDPNNHSQNNETKARGSESISIDTTTQPNGSSHLFQEMKDFFLQNIENDTSESI